MERAKVLEPDLKRQVYNEMCQLRPLPSIYYQDFIAANQEARADNLIKADKRKDQLNHLRNDIRTFKQTNKLDKVIVIWNANTERFADLINGKLIKSFKFFLINYNFLLLK
jgi:myo-inositol-1-phosphate synthase